MMKAPKIEPPTNKIISIFCYSIDEVFILSACVSGCFSSQLSRSTIWKAINPYTEVIIKRTPLSTVQSISLQLYPKLKFVFTMELPFPTAITNHSKKLITFKLLIPTDILRLASSD